MFSLRTIFTGWLFAALSTAAVTASSAPNPLLGVQTGYPDILYRSGSSAADCSYDGAGNLLITSQALTLTLVSGGLPTFITGGVVTIDADIATDGTFIGGTFMVTGVAGSFASPLLVGTLIDYGIADLGGAPAGSTDTDRMEFRFTVDAGGSLDAEMGGVGKVGGVIVTMEQSSYNAGTGFSTAWGCGVSKGNIGPDLSYTPGGGDGTGTIGYWKTHPEAWPVTSITIGDVTYSQEDAIYILKAAVKGDKTLSMAKQLIAAKLNVAAGNESSCIDGAIAAADQWLIDHGGVGSGQRQWDGGDLIHDDLDAYNNGLLCAPHRG